MLSEMTAVEAKEWEIFYSQDPFGEQRADLRNAQLCMMWTGDKNATLEQFMLYADPKPDPTPETLRAEQEYNALQLAAKLEAMGIRRHGNDSKPPGNPES